MRQIILPRRHISPDGQYAMSLRWVCSLPIKAATAVAPKRLTAATSELCLSLFCLPLNRQGALSQQCLQIPSHEEIIHGSPERAEGRAKVDFIVHEGLVANLLKAMVMHERPEGSRGHDIA